MAAEVISATNSKGQTIEFSINKTNAGLRNVIGKSHNVVYRGLLNGAEIAVKLVKIDEGSIKHEAKAIEASFYLSSHFTGCKALFNCLYGVVTNHTTQEKLTKKYMGLTPTQDAIYTAAMKEGKETVQDNEIYYLYELVKGTDVNKLLIAAKKTGADINYRKYGLQLLEALVQMRNTRFELNGKPQISPIVHLDLKPANLMIERDTDTLKIIDLNTICFSRMKSCTRHTMTFSYSGPDGAPPFEGNSTNSNILEAKRMASDIFAAGMTLHEMITNTIAIDINDIMSWREFWRTTVPEGTELDLKFPPHKMKWKPLIQSMVCRDYKERPKAMDILREFKKILAQEEEEWGGSVALPSEMGGGTRRRKRARKTNRKTKQRSTK